MGARRALAIVVSADRADDDAVRRTLQALADIGPAELVGIRVLGRRTEELPDISGLTAPVTALDASRVTAADLGDPAYVAFLRAGDVPSAAAFMPPRRDRTLGVRTGVYALVPGREYLLTRALGSRTVVAIDRDTKLTWVGSAGFLLRASVLDSCTLYDLHSTLGLESLFLEAVLVAGRFRAVPASIEPGSALEDTLTVEPCLYDPAWYFELNSVFETLFAAASQRHAAVPAWFEHAYVYLLQWRIVYNRNSSDKAILRGADLERFRQGVARVLADVPDEVVLAATKAITLDFNTRLYLLRANGADERLHYRHYSDDITLMLGRRPILSATACRLHIEAMDIERDELRVTARFTFPMDGRTMSLTATYGGAQYEGSVTRRHADSRAFGELVYRSETVDFTIPLRRGETHELHFHLVSDDPASRVHLNPSFRRWPSRLTQSRGAYWATGHYLLRYRTMGLHIAANTPRLQLEAEVAYARALLSARSLGKLRVVLLRALYLLTRPYFARRPIWVYYDKIYKAGDNGEYAYRRALTHRDGVRKCYFLRDDVPDADRFRREGVPFVPFGSLRHKLLFLNADIVFTTHIGPPSFGGFVGPAEPLYRGLYSFKVVCLQHGLSVQELSDTLNRVYDNIAVYCLASPVERENLAQPAYDYRDEQLVLTGLARYDGLVPDDRRQIVIAPTWRNYLAGPTRMGHSRGYSAAFANSPYCTLYNALINDERLLAAAREHGYRIVLLLHPVTSSQLSDFHGNDVVEVLASTDDVSYEQILTQSSLMITDYSGIQFDFAYMVKPIVYFHPPQLPPAYQEGTYHYDTMALGEVCSDIDGVVAAVSAAMARDCVVQDEYAGRIERFFAFHDRSSSERIYDVGARLQAGIDADRGAP